MGIRPQPRSAHCKGAPFCDRLDFVSDWQVQLRCQDEWGS